MHHRRPSANMPNRRCNSEGVAVHRGGVDRTMHKIELWTRRFTLTLLIVLTAPACENVRMGNLPVEDVPVEHMPVGNAPDGDVLGEGALRERWGCGDSIRGCSGKCPVMLTADFYDGSGTGTVEFAGTVSHTRYEVRGLERRWDWCLQGDGSYGCAFVIDADGDGKYFDFTRVKPDADGTRRTNPSELLKCTRRSVRDR